MSQLLELVLPQKRPLEIQVNVLSCLGYMYVYICLLGARLFNRKWLMWHCSFVSRCPQGFPSFEHTVLKEEYYMLHHSPAGT